MSPALASAASDHPGFFGTTALAGLWRKDLRPVCRIFLAATIALSNAAGAACDTGAARYEDASCASLAFDQADRELSKAYQMLLSHQDEEGKRRLREAQRAWIVWRDADARFAASSEGDGSLGRLVMINRRIDATTVRAKELLAWASQAK